MYLGLHAVQRVYKHTTPSECSMVEVMEEEEEEVEEEEEEDEDEECCLSSFSFFAGGAATASLYTQHTTATTK
jgi:hypothetical protein